jgi:hypothetical protein
MAAGAVGERMGRWQSGDESDSADEDVDEEELEGQWELDPNDPTHPDYDLSEAAGHGGWEPEPTPIFLRRGVVLAVTVVVLIALLVTILPRI